MSSLRRVLASRANGARSRGPRTAAGKRRSSQNAVRHGLLAKCLVLDNESREGFGVTLAGYLARFAPADEVELGLVEEMVGAYWRQRRAWAIETSLIDSAMAAQSAEPLSEVARIAAAFVDAAGRPRLELAHRYEARLNRIFQRSLHNLLLLRAEAPTPNEPGEADEPPVSGSAVEERGEDPVAAEASLGANAAAETEKENESGSSARGQTAEPLQSDPAIVLTPPPRTNPEPPGERCAAVRSEIRENCGTNLEVACLQQRAMRESPNFGGSPDDPGPNLGLLAPPPAECRPAAPPPELESFRPAPDGLVRRP